MTMYIPRRAAAVVCLACLLSLSFPVLAQSSRDYEKALEAFNDRRIEEALSHLSNALEQDPADLSSQLLMATVLFEQASYTEAAELYRQAMRQGADPNLARVPLAKAMLENRQFEGIAALQTSRLSKENSYLLNVIKASALVQLDRLDDAETLYQSAESMQVNAFHTALNMGHFYIRRGELQRAEAYLNVAREQSPDALSVAQLHGRYLLATGDADAALTILQRAADAAPQNPLLARSLASAFITLNQFEEAKSWVNRIVKLAPDAPHTAMLRGVFALQQDSQNRQNNIFLKVLDELSQVTLDPVITEREVKTADALLALTANNFDSAQQLLERMIELYPDDTTALVLLAETYVKLNYHGRALELLDRRRHKFNNDIPVNILLCELFIHQKRIHRCDSLLTLLSMRFTNEPTIELMKVNVMTARGRHADALTLFNNAFPSPTEPSLLHKKAQLMVNAHVYPEALSTFEYLLDAAPNDLEVIIDKAKLHIQLEEYAVAEELLLRAEKLAPELLAVQVALAHLHVEKGEAARAESLLRALPVDSLTEASRLLLGRALLMQGDYKQAENILNPMEDSSFSAADLLVEVFTAQANYSSALAIVERQLRKNRLSDKYIKKRASLLLAFGDKDQAKRELAKLYGIWLQEPEKLVNLAKLQIDAEDNEGALRSLKKALDVNPELTDGLVELARVLLKEGNITDAKLQANALKMQQPDSAISLIVSGEVAEAEGNLTLANSMFIKALQSEPSNYVAASKLFDQAMKGVNEEGFITLMQSHLNAFSDAHFQRNLLADYYFYNANLNEAKPLYVALIDAGFEQNRNAIINNMAAILTEQNTDLDFASELIEEALSNAPNNPAFLDTKGWLLASQGQPEQGLRILRQAFARNTNNASVRYHLAHTLKQLGQNKEAKEQLRSALALNTPFLGIENARRLCSELNCDG
ncbi:tetratricopeptide repeat protein [Alteromonas sediminis]|nr:tetratricopeptide repeat protein [Alteromonas sediminis]